MPMIGQPFESFAGKYFTTEPVANSDKNTESRADTSKNVANTGQHLIDSVRRILRQSYLVYFVVQRVPRLQMAFFPSKVTNWKKAILQGQNSPRITASWTYIQQKIVKLKQLGHEFNFKLLVLVIPLFEQMTSSSLQNAAYQSRLIQICYDNQIPIIDPLPGIRAIKPTYPRDFIPFDGHPTGRIDKAIADEVFTYLTNEM